MTVFVTMAVSISVVVVVELTIAVVETVAWQFVRHVTCVRKQYPDWAYSPVTVGVYVMVVGSPTERLKSLS